MTEESPSHGASRLLIDRSRTGWSDELVYSCRSCGATGETVGRLDHADSCPGIEYVQVFGDEPWVHDSARELTEPADEFGVSESTVKVLRDISYRITMLYDQAFRETEEYSSEEDSDILSSAALSIDTDELEDELADVDGVRWTATGSTHRVILSLGRTTPYGEFHLPSQTGVVMKVDPRIRIDQSYTPVSSNLDELYTYEMAVETGTEEYFADIIACAPDGMWLLMEQTTPISLSVRSEMKHRDMLHDSGGSEYIYPLTNALNEAGWKNPDYKHGNVGLTDDDDVVLLDYGTGPDRIEAEDD